MSKKQQRIASVIIGIILAGLLLMIGVRIVQRRASEANQLTNLQCNRDTDSVGIVEGASSTCDPISANYGASSSEAIFVAQSTAVPGSGGSCTHTFTLSGLQPKTMYNFVLGDQTCTVPAEPESANTQDSQTDEQLVDEILPTSAPEITEEPTVTPEEEPTPTEDDSRDRVEVTVQEATALYTDGTFETVGDCTSYYQQKGSDDGILYVGTSIRCVQAYEAVNSSE